MGIINVIFLFIQFTGRRRYTIFQNVLMISISPHFPFSPDGNEQLPNEILFQYTFYGFFAWLWNEIYFVLLLFMS